jgi:4-hydroxybenzoate polyprenyltransferase
VSEPAAVVVLPVRVQRSRAHALLVALRPRQWSKNLLLFAGIVFAAQIGDATRWVEALAAFAAYCAASSAAYLTNDVVDAPRDRRHPVKQFRPLAARELTDRLALGLAAALAVGALAVAALLGPWSLLFMAGVLALQAAYSVRLKHVVLIDVLAIAGLFVVRAAAGAAAVEVRISPWLLLCTALLALFLALAKRRGELVLVGGEATPARHGVPREEGDRGNRGGSPDGAGGALHRRLSGQMSRPVLEGYSLALADQLIAVVAAATISAYSLYTLTVHTDAMVATVPFVLFGLFRYLLLVHRRDLGEEPEELLLRDRPLLAAVAAWATVAATILVLD